MIVVTCACRVEPTPTPEVSSKEEGEVIVPAPWTEVLRKSNPSKTLDGILVQRPFGKDAIVTHLYIKPYGEAVENEPPYELEYLAVYNGKSLEKACLVAYDASEMSLSWKDDTTLQITGQVYNNSCHTCFAQKPRGQVRGFLHGNHAPVRLIFDLTDLGRKPL